MTWFNRLRLRIAALFCKPKELFYINGPDTLPSPLSAEEEAVCIEHIEEDDVRARLIEHNLRLVVYVAKKFENVGTGIEDLISIGTVGLIKAINTFRADKSIKLATYASRCIENEILMYIRKNSNLRLEISIDEPLSTDGDGGELLLSDILGNDEDNILYEIEQNEEKAILRSAVATLAPREREIVSLRFGLNGCEELTQKEVADRLGISQSYISRLEKKIIAHLRREIEGKL